MRRIFDYVFITRPILFFPGWSTLLLGYWLAQFRIMGRGPEVFDNLFPAGNELLLLVGFAMLMGGSFIFNQIRDAESDRINEKLYFIHQDIIPLKAAWIEALILIATGMLLLIILDKFNLILTGVIFVFVTAYAYNYPPLECKNKVVLGLIANVLMGECAFALGYFFSGQFSFTSMFVDSLGILLLNTGLYVLTTLPDIEGDKASQKNTLGSWAGEKHGARFGAILIISAFLFLPLSEFWVWILAAVTLPVMIWVILSPLTSHATIGLKLTIFTLSLVMSFYWIWFFVLGVLSFWGTKQYFKRKFNLDYPSFSGS